MATSSNYSKLLINEPPLQVQPSLAVKVGLNGAIFLQQVHYWISRPGAHERDGRFWVYNSLPEWQEQFPFWSEDTIQRTIAGLQHQGVLLSGNYNAAKFDRTKWYTIDYEALDALEVTPPPRKSRRPSRESASASPQVAVTITAESGEQRRKLRRPIPETNTETTAEREIAPAPVTGDIPRNSPSPSSRDMRIAPGTPVNKRPDAPRQQPRPIEIPCPTDFIVTDEMRTWARANTPTLTAQLPALTRLFVSYYTGGKGAGTRAVSWFGMWQTWMLRQVTDYAGSGGKPALAVVPGPEPRYITARSS